MRGQSVATGGTLAPLRLDGEFQRASIRLVAAAH